MLLVVYKKVRKSPSDGVRGIKRYKVYHIAEGAQLPRRTATICRAVSEHFLFARFSRQFVEPLIITDEKQNLEEGLLGAFTMIYALWES